MALADRGVDAISYTGSQVGIITDTSHRKAKIVEVKGDRVRQSLSEGKVCVIAGFQGVSTDKEITTMGRGASDLTASALAQAMGADACEIYTDVTGVFTADPRRDASATLIPFVSADDPLLSITADGGGSGRGSGGMASKLIAARMASWSGIRSVIARASRPGVLAGSASADGGRSGGAGIVEPASSPGGDQRTRCLGVTEPEGGDVDITAEDVLIVVGRGIESEDNIEEAQELADALGGAVAASRPIIDQGEVGPIAGVDNTESTFNPHSYR